MTRNDIDEPVKLEKLKKLRKEIIDHYFVNEERQEDVWFFPPGSCLKDDSVSCKFIKSKIESVQGFLGSDNIVFLAINPSTGRFNQAAVTFYELLQEQGFGNAHITDVFKQRNVNWKNLIGTEAIEEAKRFLKKEIEIVKPKLIVCMGEYNRVYKDNRSMLSGILEELKDLKVKRIYIRHYAFRYGKRKQLRNRLNDILQGIRTILNENLLENVDRAGYSLKNKSDINKLRNKKTG